MSDIFSLFYGSKFSQKEFNGVFFIPFVVLTRFEIRISAKLNFKNMKNNEIIIIINEFNNK